MVKEVSVDPRLKGRYEGDVRMWNTIQYNTIQCNTV